MLQGHAFDRWAPTYDRSPLQLFLFSQVHRAVLRELRAQRMSDLTVLDIGCGTGKLLETIHRQWPGVRSVGVDPAPKMIEVARGRLMASALYVAGAEALPVNAGSVDVAISTVSLHHWPDKRRAMTEIARVLRPGGRALIVDLAGPLWLSRVLKDPPYVRAAERTALCREAGLEHIRNRAVWHPYLLMTLATKGPARR